VVAEIETVTVFVALVAPAAKLIEAGTLHTIDRN